jgi:hypothetical protein
MTDLTVAFPSDLGVFKVFSIPIIYFLYSETANRKVEDTDIVFNEGLRLLVPWYNEATQVKSLAGFVAVDVQGVGTRGLR